MKKIKKWWFYFRHEVVGWHNCKGNKKVTFDGCSLGGVCECGRKVLQNSNGDWFTTKTDKI